jgi:hypothetical protein
MRKLHKHSPLTDYSAAVARAIAWLGDRYLLARAVNVAPGRHSRTTVSCPVLPSPAMQRDFSV